MCATSHDFFVLRRPLLSLDAYYDFQGLSASGENAFEQQIKKTFADPLLQQAVYLASSDLYALMLLLLEDKPLSNKKKVLFSLYKYFLRSATRCTPFGLFAGYCQGQVGGKTHVRFDQKNPYQRQTRPDMQLLFEVSQSVKATAGLPRLRYYPNTSLYLAGSQYRYMERVSDGQAFAFTLSQVPSGPFLDTVLNEAKAGLTTYEIETLLSLQGLEPMQARQYTESLIDAQILVSDLEINLTGNAFHVLLQEKIKEDQEGYQTLESFHGLLFAPEFFMANHSLIRAYLKKDFPCLQARTLIHTDLRLTTDACTLNPAISQILLKELEALSPLLAKPESKDLAIFARALYERFGPQAIALTTALDLDYGVGYGRLTSHAQGNFPLLEGLQESAAESSTLPIHNGVLRIYQEALSRNLQQVTLSDALLSDYFEPAENQVPESFFLLGSLLAGSETALEAGDFSFEFKGMGGPCSLNLLTRFAVQDDVLQSKILETIRREESLHPDIIYAEITHLPGFKEANILARPALRNYEIPYLAASTRPQAFQILPCDLQVSSPDGKSILLSSKRLKKQVIPMLTSAHNFTNGLPLYRFLAEFSQSRNGDAYLHWDWGGLITMPFLPRITYKHWILSKSVWNLDQNTLDELTKGHPTLTDAWLLISSRLSIPRYFFIGHADHQLLIDGLSMPALEILVDLFKKSRHIRLTECLFCSGSNWLQKENQSFCNEIILPVKGKIKKQPEFSFLPEAPSAMDFNLGSSWLYVKLYCAAGLSDQVLRELIVPLCEKLTQEQTVEKWFFVRYQDPQPHLRIRFYNHQNKEFWMIVLKALYQAAQGALDTQVIYKIQTDTYQREHARYSMLDYEKVESLFFADSVFVSGCLPLLSQTDDADLRWLLAMRSADRLLSDLDYDLHSKMQLVDTVRQTFSAECNSPAQKVQMDLNYRQKKAMIGSVMNPSPGGFFLSETWDHLLLERTKAITNILGDAAVLDPGQHHSLTSSLLHMHLNRWLCGHHREQEFIIYHYLSKFYDAAWNYYRHIKKNRQTF